MQDVTNKVTLFSNGITDFLKSYSVEKGKDTKISIAVKPEHVGDILASLNVYGDITLKEPPSFESNDENNNFSIDASNSIEDLVTKLSGAKVSLNVYGGSNNKKGVLIGLHEDKVDTGNCYSVKSISVLTKDGIQNTKIDDISSIIFEEKNIKLEIDKALSKNLQKIKPNSKFVNLTVFGNNDASRAIVQYAVPNSAWKISYRLNEDDNKVYLKGLAIVDNNTEENWTDVIVSVVAGEPITFSTDLAEQKVPKRNHVNVVKNQVVDAVEPRQVVNACCKGPSNRIIPISAMSFAGPACGPAIAAIGGVLEPEDVEIKEIDDYSVFTSMTPVTILANSSAIVPVFNVKLDNCKTVLFYKTDSKTNRPYRAIELKNETNFSFPRGVATVFKDTNLVGSAIFPETKQNEDQILVYALETGVKINSIESEIKQEITKITLKSGIYKSEIVNYKDTEIVILNKKKESFEVYIDVIDCFNETVTAMSWTNVSKSTLPQTRIKGGYRYKIKIKENETISLKVNQFEVEKTEFVFRSYNLNDFVQTLNLINRNNVDLKIITSLLNQKELVSEKIGTLRQEIKKLTEKQTRIRENLKVLGTGEDAANSRKDLVACETLINQYEQQIPESETEQRDINNKIENELKALVFDFESK